MDIRQNPLWLSFPVGRYFRTDVRVSVWFPLLAVLLFYNLGLELGLWTTIVLFGSILLHEFGHIAAARRTGGSGHEILIWPLGGLASASPAPNFYSEMWTTIAGPLTNGVICLLCLPAVMAMGKLADCLHPILLPPMDFAQHLGRSLLLLTFSLNLRLLVVNLLPVFPLDGGQLACGIVTLSQDRQTAKLATLWFGLIVCIVLSSAGLMLQSTETVFFGFLLMMLCMHEFQSVQISRQFDDSFMGYDFSQGYTSLEGSPDRESLPKPPGFFERWQRNRAQKKREQEQQQKLETERRVDELLDKVHQHGMQSLTDAERRFLQRASSRYRSPGKE